MEKRKRATNKPLTTLLLDKFADENGHSKTKRIKTVKCGLKRSLVDKKTHKIFDSLCTRLGLQRHIVSLFTNYLILKRIDENKDIPEINKQLYDRSWSAMVSCINNESVKADHYTDYFEQFIIETNLDVKSLTESTKYEIRQPITRDMATSAKEHIIKNLHKRMYKYIKFRIMDEGIIPSSLNNYKNILFKIVLYICDCIRNDDDDSINGLDNLLDEYKIDKQYFHTFIKDEKICLKDAINYKITTKSGNEKTGFCIALKANPNIFIKYLCKISIYLENKRKTTYEVMKMAREKYPLKIDKKNRSEFIKNKLKDHITAPTQFNILPIWKLQPAFIELAYTQLVEIFGKKFVNKDNIGDNIFNVDFIPNLETNMSSINKLKWNILQYQTNGYQLNVKLQTLGDIYKKSFNTENLVKKGYDLKKPKEKTDLNDNKGLFVMSQIRNDFKSNKNMNKENIIIHAIDPGRAEVITSCDVKLSDCNNPSSIYENGEFWSVSNKDYCMETGRYEQRKRELQRRERFHYNNCITILGNERKKTCILINFINYCKAVSSCLSVLYKEKNRKSRRATNFYVKIKTDVFIDKLANKFADRTSLKISKESKEWKQLSPDERRELRAKWRQEIEEKKKTKHIVFFGDGKFSPGGRGYASVPRKKLLHQIASVCQVFLLDEYGTSKFCPGCGSEMEDLKGEHRVRRCTSEKNKCGKYSCKLSKNNELFCEDRDISATISMAYCAHEGMVNSKRPHFLCRQKSKEDKIIESICEKLDTST